MPEVSRKLVMLRCTEQKMLTVNIFSWIRSEEQINVFTKDKQVSSVADKLQSQSITLHLHLQCRAEPFSLAAPWTEVRTYTFCLVWCSCQPQQLSGVLLRILSDPTRSKNRHLHFFISNLKVALSSKQSSLSLFCSII